ncbi:RTA1-domain-containing protein [Aspergillus uvarum CBS 121591]|uniref:RTA1-domain-containing protein n=1 Tax=Aspergillus uvarum CBS 121591 TaxID=1448315 RepID=A0A319E6S0_9EURO|nr:RTA1-domain-containing protein [Aspergillus uvarum CBS 121591]PYH86762.1 RTA1-domain-containing protein [Aspergillus uvarum CBS 121591]
MADSVTDLTTGCHALIDGYGTPYGYLPAFAPGVVFCTLFGLLAGVHVIQIVTYRRFWWTITFVVGCLTEVLGWAARIWTTRCPYNLNAFLVQFSTLIIAPTFFTAGIYILLGCFVQIMGRRSSFLSPRSYLWIFSACDLISIVIQAVGGGIASADSKKANGNLDHGSNIMLAGVVFQLFSITIFIFCACDVFYRVHQFRLSVSGASISLWRGVLTAATVCIYIRCIYRTVELGQGPGGYLLLHENYLIALDAVMMVLLVGICAVFHPGWLTPQKEFLRLSEVQLLERVDRPK